jgi:hypothetical protein
MTQHTLPAEPRASSISSALAVLGLMLVMATLAAGITLSTDALDAREGARTMAWAAAIWSAYAAAVGAIGGEAFGESFGRALILALVSASALAVIGELVHRRRRPRGRDVPAEPDGICLGSSGANPSPPARGLISRQAPQRARSLQ